MILLPINQESATGNTDWYSRVRVCLPWKCPGPPGTVLKDECFRSFARKSTTCWCAVALSVRDVFIWGFLLTRFLLTRDLTALRGCAPSPSKRLPRWVRCLSQDYRELNPQEPFDYWSGRLAVDFVSLVVAEALVQSIASVAIFVLVAAFLLVDIILILLSKVRA